MMVPYEILCVLRMTITWFKVFINFHVASQDLYTSYSGLHTSVKTIINVFLLTWNSKTSQNLKLVDGCMSPSTITPPTAAVGAASPISYESSTAATAGFLHLSPCCIVSQSLRTNCSRQIYWMIDLTTDQGIFSDLKSLLNPSELLFSSAWSF